MYMCWQQDYAFLLIFILPVIYFAMSHRIKKWCILLASCGLLYLWWILVNGYTNSASATIVVNTGFSLAVPDSNIQVHAYLSQHPEDTQAVYLAYGYLNGTWSVDTGRFPQDVENDLGFKFIINGIETRKEFLNTIKQASAALGIDYTIVLSSLLSEQIRIASKWVRWELKDIVIHSTPKLLRSYNISLGIGGIKVSTAKRIAKDAQRYGYGDVFLSGKKLDLISNLTISDYRQWIYPTYLVKNIITRRSLSWYDISHNPGIVGTLYNMGNPIDKPPHADPEIWGAVITIGKHKYVYWWIAMGLYRYLKIYK